MGNIRHVIRSREDVVGLDDFVRERGIRKTARDVSYDVSSLYRMINGKIAVPAKILIKLIELGFKPAKQTKEDKDE